MRPASRDLYDVVWAFGTAWVGRRREGWSGVVICLYMSATFRDTSVQKYSRGPTSEAPR